MFTGLSRHTVQLIIALLLQICITELAAEPVREQEINNAITTAQPVSPPASIGGRISSATDTDYYAFRAEPGDSIHADVLARGFRAGAQPGSDLSARLALLDTDGTTVLVEDVSNGDYDDPFIEYTLTASGTYYLRVTDQNNTGGTGHTYILSVERELSDITDTAVWITPPVLTSIDTLIHPPGDIDNYKFHAFSGQVVTIDIDSAVFNPVNPPAQTIVVLSDDSGTIISQDGYDPVSDPYDPYIQATLPADGVYRIEVKERRSYVGTTNTFYQLSVDLSPTASNNTFTNASPVSLPATISGTLSPAGDIDYYSFNLETSATVNADMDATEDLLSLLTAGTLGIYNASGLIAQDNSTPDPQLTSIVANGVHAISVSGSSSDLPEDTYFVIHIDTDPDNDGVVLPYDNCPATPNPLQSDSDGDGVGDLCDLCPDTFGPEQTDSDGDLIGDACDPDDDNDGLDDDFERSIGTNPYATDTDGDGLTDYEEVAYDGDPDTFVFFSDLNPMYWDSDFDGISDLTDPVPLHYNFNDGDLAPLGAPDGVINAGDLIIAIRMALGLITPTSLDLSHGDLHPPGSPDGVINVQDVIILMQLL